VSNYDTFFFFQGEGRKNRRDDENSQGRSRVPDPRQLDISSSESKVTDSVLAMTYPACFGKYRGWSKCKSCEAQRQCKEAQ